MEDRPRARPKPWNLSGFALSEFSLNQVVDSFRSSLIAVSINGRRTFMTKVELIVVSIDIHVSFGSTKMQVVDEDVKKKWSQY